MPSIAGASTSMHPASKPCWFTTPSDGGRTGAAKSSQHQVQQAALRWPGTNLVGTSGGTANNPRQLDGHRYFRVPPFRTRQRRKVRFPNAQRPGGQAQPTQVKAAKTASTEYTSSDISGKRVGYGRFPNQRRRKPRGHVPARGVHHAIMPKTPILDETRSTRFNSNVLLWRAGIQAEKKHKLIRA